MVDYPGRIAAVFFTPGCNFRCGYCHNPGLRDPGAARWTWRELRERCERLEAQWVDAAVVTGGEPTLQPELPGLLQTLRGRGWRVKLDTNGSRPDRLAACLPWVDYVAMDIKADDAGYEPLTGFGNLEALRESIRLLMTGRVAYEFRTTAIDDIHDEETIRAMGESVRGARLHVLQGFVPRDELVDAAFVARPATPRPRLEALAAILEPFVQRVAVRP